MGLVCHAAGMMVLTKGNGVYLGIDGKDEEN